MQLDNILRNNTTRGEIQQHVEDLSSHYSQMTLRCHVLRLVHKFPHLQQNLLSNVAIAFHHLDRIRLDPRLGTDDKLYMQLVGGAVEEAASDVPVVSVRNAILLEISYRPGVAFGELQSFLARLVVLRDRDAPGHMHLVELTGARVVFLIYGRYGSGDAGLYRLLVACLRFCFHVQRIEPVQRRFRLACGDVRGTCLCSHYIQFAVAGPCRDELAQMSVPTQFDNRVYTSLQYYQRLRSLQLKHEIEERLGRHKRFRCRDADRFDINVEFADHGQVAVFKE